MLTVFSDTAIVLSILECFFLWIFCRFKDGLSALNVIHALEQHASIFKAFMCPSVEQLTSTTLDNLFEVQLSEQGTTRRQEEPRVLAFWRDLLDTEGLQYYSSISYNCSHFSHLLWITGLVKNIFISFSDKQKGLSLPDILMFATGLSSLPPSGINPKPKLVFQRVSHFPCSRTCANTMEIPLSMTY